jgi:Na+:H+ antiporter, NhaC family
MMTKKQPTLLMALFPIAILISFLAVNVIIFDTVATEGPNQIALLLSAAVAGIISWRLNNTWEEIEFCMVKSISSAMGAMIILLVIGALSGTWLLSGIVPAMIYYPNHISFCRSFSLLNCFPCHRKFMVNSRHGRYRVIGNR